MSRIGFLLLFLSLTSLSHTTHGLVVTGQLTSNDDWVFLAKFCFISRSSQFFFTLNSPDSYAVQSLVLYYDYQWAKIYHSSKSCEEKLSILDPTQVLSMDPTGSMLNCVDDQTTGQISCSDERGFITSRPRWWYVALVRCNSSGLKLDYTMKFYNGPGVFVHQFSADEFGIFQSTIAFSVFYAILILFCIVFGVLLQRKKLLHVTFRLFVSSVVLQFISFVVYLIHCAQFSQTGLYLEPMIIVSRIFEMVAQIVFMIMLILVAKGYTITRSKLRKVTIIKMVVFFSVYTVCYVAAFIYNQVTIDPGLVNYFYNSPPAIAILAIKLVIGWTWFMYSIIFTIKNYPEKRVFYIFLVIFFTIWFFIGPVVIILSIYGLVDYYRQEVSYITLGVIISLGHLFFLILVRPWPKNKMFPYHVKTNAIGVITNDEKAKKKNPADKKSAVTIVGDEKEDTGNYPHHEPGKGGNEDFNDLGLRDLIKGQNRQKKYQVPPDYSPDWAFANKNDPEPAQATVQSMDDPK